MQLRFARRQGVWGPAPSLRCTSWLSWISSGYPHRELVLIYPCISLSQTSYPYRCRTRTILTPKWISPRHWMHPLPRGFNSFTDFAEDGITVLSTFLFASFTIFFLVSGFGAISAHFFLYAPVKAAGGIILHLGTKSRCKPSQAVLI